MRDSANTHITLLLGLVVGLSGAGCSSASGNGASPGSGDSGGGTSPGSDGGGGGRHLGTTEDGGSGETGSTRDGGADSGCGSQFGSAVMADAPLAYYPMNDASGTTMTDLVTPSVAGTYGSGVRLGQTGLVPSERETSARFSGGVFAASNVATVPQSGQLPSGSGLSIELFFEEDAVNAGTVGDGYIDVVSDVWSVQVAPTNVMKLWLPTAGGSIQVLGTTQITARTAHQVDATYDGKTATLYLDGKVEAAATGSGTVSVANASGLSIGGSASTPTRSTLAGRIGQVSLYAASLTASRVAAHYHASGLDGSASCSSGDAGASHDSGSSHDSSAPPPASDGGISPTRVAALDASPYPRLGSYLIGGSPRSYNDPSFIAWAAKQQVVIMGIWDGWEKDQNASMQATIEAIHSQSTLATPPVALLYSDLYDRALTVSAGQPEYPVYVAMNANKWWLLSTFPSGSIENDQTWSTTNGVGNEVPGGPVDSMGRDYVHFVIQYENDWQVGGGSAGLAVGGNAPDDAVDGFYHDVLFAATAQGGDWSRIGTDDSAANTTDSHALREGENDALVYRGQSNPGKFLTGNLSGFQSTTSVSTELQGTMQGGVLEGMIGETWSVEGWGGFAQMMAAYEKQMNMLSAPGLGIFAHSFVAANGSDPTTSTPFQAMRYGLATTLMGDAYYFPNEDGASGYDCNNHLWFDEFDNAGAGLGYLGQPLAGPSYVAAWQSGVFRRDFEHGIALVNPKGQGTVTVTLEKAYKHIQGVQETTMNNGQSVTTVTLEDRDGVILLTE